MGYEQCIKNEQCSSNYCKDTRCTNPKYIVSPYDPCSPFLSKCTSGYFCSEITQRCVSNFLKDDNTGITCLSHLDCSPTDFCDEGYCVSRKHEGESCSIFGCEDGLICISSRSGSHAWMADICVKKCIPGSLSFDCGSGKTCEKMTGFSEGVCIDKPVTTPWSPKPSTTWTPSPTSEPYKSPSGTPTYSSHRYESSSSTSSLTIPIIVVGAVVIAVILGVLVYLCRRRRRKQPQFSPSVGFPAVGPDQSPGAMPVYTQSIHDSFMQPQPRYDPGPAPYPYTAADPYGPHDSSGTPPTYSNIYPDLPTAPISHSPEKSKQ